MLPIRTSRSRAALAAMAALCWFAPAYGLTTQPSPPIVRPSQSQQGVPTGVVRGRVTTFPDGEPIDRARVMLTRPDKEYAWVTLTDSDGRYELQAIPDYDNYMLSASKTGYAPRVWGEAQLPTPPTPLVVEGGKTVDDIDVALAEQLWISGKISDSDGTPFAGAVVSALRAVFVEDRREMVTVAEIITDDRGEYRLFGLPAGQYYVSAADPAFLSTGDYAGPLAYAPTYYPGIASAEQAERVIVEPGQPRSNIDFALSIIRPARVAGRIVSYDDRPLVVGAVVMSPLRADRPASFSVTHVDLRPDGRYQFHNVPPGRFIIRARGQVERDGNAMFGAFALGVSGTDVEQVDMTLMPGARLSGLVEWDGTAPRPPVSQRARVRAPLVDGSLFGDALTGTITADDTFVIRGVTAGRHLLRVENLQQPWSLKRVYVRGQDVTDIPLSFEFGQEETAFRIVLTDKATTLQGRLISMPGDDFESYAVVAFAANQLLWRPGSRHVKLVRPDRSGQFSFHGLPPAVYYLTATRGVDEGDLGDIRTLDRLAVTAMAVELAEAEHKFENLRVRPPATAHAVPIVQR